MEKYSELKHIGAFLRSELNIDPEPVLKVISEQLKKQNVLDSVEGREISPCPFCDGAAKVVTTIADQNRSNLQGWCFVQCWRCGCKTDLVRLGQAVDVWNTRTLNDSHGD
ncbi:MAG: hypothetical protein HS105_05870 [Chloracidobacterium sp.]|nr:hypothetical protein [Chloracidobacterium sp.]